MSENQKINIEKLADLSMLTLSEEEKERFSRDIEQIIRFYEELNEATPCPESDPRDFSDRNNVFREDEVTNEDRREELLKNAETNDGRYVSVPKVIGGGQK